MNLDSTWKMSGRIRLIAMDRNEYAPVSMSTVTEDMANVRVIVWTNDQGEVIAMGKLPYPGLRVGDKFECSTRNGQRVVTYQPGPWTYRRSRDHFLWQSPLFYVITMCTPDIHAYLGLVLGFSFMMFVCILSALAIGVVDLKVTVRRYVPYLLVILSISWILKDEVIVPLIILLLNIAGVFAVEYWNPPFLSVLSRQLDSFLSL